MNNFVSEAERKMTGAIERMKMEMQKIRTGRASSSLVEDIKVSYYGVETALKELSTITAPEPALIQIKPFDRNSIGDIEMAIRNADIGLSPINDGVFVRLNLPPITEERRTELVKQVKKMGEETKVEFRTIRGEIWEQVQNKQKNKEITEDDRYRLEKELNDLIAKKNSEIEKIVSDKSAELMRI